MMRTKHLSILLGLVVALSASPAVVSAQPMGLGTCGGYLAPPLPIGGPCRFVCVRETLGNSSPMQPAPSRMVWRRICHVSRGDLTTHGPIAQPQFSHRYERGPSKTWINPHSKSLSMHRPGLTWLNPQPEPPRPDAKLHYRVDRGLGGSSASKTGANPHSGAPSMPRPGLNWLNPQPEPPRPDARFH